MSRGYPFVALVLASFVSCSTASHVIVGKTRPPIAATQVKIYLHPPANYEEIAILEATSEGSPAITAQGKTNKVIERLKNDAAQLGANGILLQAVGNETGGAVATGLGSSVTTGSSTISSGTIVMAGSRIKTGNAIAIFVPEQPAP